MKGFSRTVSTLILPLLLVAFVLLGTPLFAEGRIRIGASLSMSGDYHEPSDMIRRGYLFWEREINRRGGLLGRQVELVIEDDRSDPGMAKDIYRRLIEEEQVDLLLSPYGTPLTMAASEVTEAAGMVMVAAGAAGREVWERGFRYVFGTYSPADRFFIGFLSIIARYGIEEVLVIHEENSFNRNVVEGVVEWAVKMGLDIGGITGFSTGRDEIGDVLDRAGISDRVGLIISSYPETGYEALRELRKRPVQPAALAMTIIPAHPLFGLRMKGGAEGVFAPSLWEPRKEIPYPGTREFTREFLSFSHIEASYHAGAAYAACQVLSRAVEETGSLDHEKLRDHISATDTVTIIGRFKVDETGRQVAHNPLLIQWQDGKKEIVYPEKMKTADPVFP